SDGNTATIQMWIDDVLVENFGGRSSYEFTWEGHTDGLYISFENNNVLDKTVDNVVIASSFSPTQAFDASPAEQATDIPRDVVLNWAPGEYASAHDVYFGVSLDDVNNATATVDPAGVYQGRQDVSSYGVGEPLDFGRTYYWRVDEVNAAPDYTVFKGDVWSFTVEPFAVPIPGRSIAVTASSANRSEEGPENTVNGSGLDDDALHSVQQTDMWLSSGVDPNATWIQYEFDRAYKLYQMWVWNYNTTVEPLVGFGIREATIEYSVDGTDWVKLGTTHEFAQGSGVPGYASNTAVDLSGVTARYVRITANSNWSPFGLNQFGLSEIRFLYIPVWAREPSPDSGATGVDVDAILSFRAGREAARHDVHLSTDEQVVIDGSTPVATVTEPSYASPLDLASIYYWRIDEVNDAETPTTWQGDIWSLSTQEYLVVDDFESYNDIPTGEEGSNLIYETWADGFGVATNGSTTGYTEAFQPSMETSIVHDGSQSVPLFYDNTAAAYSEVTANLTDLQVGKDWTKYGIKGLTIRFFGDAANVVQLMYVKLNGTKVVYDGSAEDTRLAGWQMWYIDLASIGVNLSNVTEFSIGFERIGTLGGQGMVLLDAIRLYSHDRQLITPIEPGTAGLQAHYEFEGNTNDSSGNARHGVGANNPMFAPGKTGQAIGLNGLDQYVTITGYKGILADASGVQQPFTVAAWVKTIDDGDRTIASWGTNSNQLRVDFRLFQGRLRVEHGAGNVQGDTTLNDDEWHHVAVTVSQGATISYPEVQLWLDGMDNTRDTTDPEAFSIATDVDMAIGYRATAVARYFFGAIDDVRLYDRVLSPEEMAWLAGRIEPFDRPF
ncbi:MAG: LamG-like jellyroll fold domain-containing protein, partial [Planctomycetota bacterium]